MPRSPEDGGRPAANDIHTTYMTYITYTEGGVLPALGRHIAPLANGVCRLYYGGRMSEDE